MKNKVLVSIFAFAFLAAFPALAQEALGLKQEADALLRSGEYRKAAQQYRAFLQTEPRSAAAYFDLAIAHFQAGETGPAAAALEELVRIDPSDYEAHYNLGCLALYRKNFERAERHFLDSLQDCPPEAEFSMRIRGSLGFARSLHGLDPQTQELALAFFLRQIGLTA